MCISRGSTLEFPKCISVPEDCFHLLASTADPAAFYLGSSLIANVPVYGFPVYNRFQFKLI